MKQEEQQFEINGRKYRLVYDFTGEGEVGSECANCDLQSECDNAEGLICHEVVGDDNARHKRFEAVPDDDTPLPEEPCGNIDIKEAVDAMYYHTKKANQVWWVMLGVVAVAVALGLTGVGAALLAVASLVAALMQNVWQGVALEWFVRRLDADGCSKFDSYPSLISNGGWAFYAVKMILALSALVAMVVGFE